MLARVLVGMLFFTAFGLFAMSAEAQPQEADEVPDTGSHSAPEPAAEQSARLSGAGRVVEISGWIGKAVDGMARAVSAAIAGLFGGENGAPGPVDEPLAPSVPVPDVPAPAAPTPVGISSFAGGSFSSWTLSSAADHEKLLQLFAVLVAFSLTLMQGGERRWITREALGPSLLARPPNQRPG